MSHSCGRVFGAWLLCVAWSGAVWAADVFVGTPPLNPLPGQQFSIELFVDVGSETLGSYDFEFQYDASVVNVVSIGGGTAPEFSTAPVTDPNSFASGATPIAAVHGLPGAPTGFLSVATIELEAVGERGDSSVLDLAVLMLFSGVGDSLPSSVFASSVLLALAVPSLSEWGILGLVIGFIVTAGILQGRRRWSLLRSASGSSP